MPREHPPPPRSRSPAALPSQKSTNSFWHTQPSPLLTAHRSTRHLPKTCDVVIIGSGITGASIAHHLLAPDAAGTVYGGWHGRPLDVVMLEAREACWGATGRNGGHCQPLPFKYPHDPSIGRFELANFHAIEALIREKSIDCEFVAQPGVRAIYSPQRLDEAEGALSIMRTAAPDLAAVTRLTTDQAELEKYRVPTARGALATSIAARLWPYKFVSHILEELITSQDLRGTFNLQTLTPAEALVPRSNEEGGWTITTPRGRIEAQKVVLATNAYTSHLVPSFSDLIVPCRGQMSALEPVPSVRDKDRLKTSLGFEGVAQDDYLIQRPNERGGHLMFGGGRQHDPCIGVTDDSVIEYKTAAYLRRHLFEALGLPEASAHSAEFKAANEWTGIMGFSRDDLPWVGAVPGMQSVYMAAGFTGHGMPNTWLCGKTVARLVAANFADADQERIMERATAETGLPASYRLTSERVKRVMETEDDVEAKDWAEMHPPEARERPPSGYA